MTRGVDRPHMADATDVERWADQRSAQADLPRLVRRLIRHENDQVQRVEMRGGEGVGLPGYDGIVEATRASSFVPKGASVWEMGVSEDPAGKATEDYKTRTADPLGVDMATTTFVFLTPRRWRLKKSWERKRRKEGKWLDVRVLDADDIEQALDESPAVRIWLSELLEMPALGAVTIEEWWQRFSNAFDPTLAPEVVLSGREDHAGRLLQRLSLDVGRTFIRAASVDDGLAFAACAMKAQGPEQSEPMLSRALIVHDGVTLRRLDGTSSLLILLPYEEGLQRDAQLVRNHHVVFVVTEGDADIELPPLDHVSLEAALRRSGVGPAELTKFVRAGTKSLLALQRVSARLGQVDPPEWTQDLAGHELRRAWLAGAWNALRSADVEIVGDLTGSSSDDLEERLERVVRQPDPIFTRVGSTWAVAAPEDSWRAARHAIRDADLARLEQAVQIVLGAIDPRLELPPQDRWSAAIYGKIPVHSADLRKGLARSVDILGSHGDDVRLAGGRTARQWAEQVVWRLFSRANEDPSAQLWASLSDVLPLLAEAAPDVFLRAASEAATGDDPLLRSLFQDKDDSWSASSPHTGVLWALECVAWSERHMSLAAEVLASLAELDPGGRLSNRPSASLRDIFRPWMPQTSAPLATRTLTLDGLIARHEETAWKLLIELLPGPSEVGMRTCVPRFHEWADDRGPVTYEELFRSVDAIAERLLKLAVAVPSRWTELVPAFDRLPPERRREATNVLATLNRTVLDEASANAVWTAIEEFVRHHRQYSDAEWSLPEEWLTSLEVVAAPLKPPLATEVHKWLFDDWTPDIGVSVVEDFALYEDEVEQARRAAAKDILESQNFSSVIELARRVVLPWALGSAVAHVGDANDASAIAQLDSADRKLVQFAEGYVRARTGGSIESIRVWVQYFADRPTLQARLLQIAQNVSEAWELLAQLDSATDAAYWAEFMPYGRGTDFPQAAMVTRQLLDHGRAAMAVDTLSLYAGRGDESVEAGLVIEALRQFGTTDDPDNSRVSEHDLTTLLDYLRARGVDDTEIALLEWKFLPAMHQEPKAPSLQRLLSRDPASFVQLIEVVYKPANSRGVDEAPRFDPGLVSNAFRLLREWQVVPGTRSDGTVDPVALEGWLSTVRGQLADSDRLDVGELQIGEVLAHAPTDLDGTFPTKPVRDVLEAASSDRLERGFMIGLENKRGVTSRGMTEGGQQEYDLAKKYDRWAQLVQATHPRTSAALRVVADSYREDGRRNDEEARRFVEGLEL